MLQANKDIDVIYFQNDEMYFGGMKAIEASGRRGEMKIVSVDGNPEALAAIQKGELDYEVVGQFNLQGWLVIETAAKVLAGEQVPDGCRSSSTWRTRPMRASAPPPPGEARSRPSVHEVMPRSSPGIAAAAAVRIRPLGSGRTSRGGSPRTRSRRGAFRIRLMRAHRTPARRDARHSQVLRRHQSAERRRTPADARRDPRARWRQFRRQIYADEDPVWHLQQRRRPVLSRARRSFSAGHTTAACSVSRWFTRTSRFAGT